MATVVTKTVKPGGGGDYTTLNAAVAALPANLVSADEQWTIECYAGGNLVTAAVSLAGVTTTDATRYVRITAPTAERHAGVYSTSKAYASVDVAGHGLLYNLPPYTRVEFLQIRAQGDDNNMKGIESPAVAGVRIQGCLILAAPTTTTFWTANCYGIDLGTDVAGDCFVWNNILYGWNVKTTGNRGLIVINHNSGKTYCYNNTFVDCYVAIQDGYGDIVIKNCLMAGSNAVLSGTVDASSDYNTSDLGATTGGTNDRISQTFTFLNAAAKDYHLDPTDAGARGFGVDLSGDSHLAVVDDVDGQTRAAPWDIGADQATIPATTEQEGSRFRNDDGSETTATWKAAQDTDVSGAVGSFRLRVIGNATGDPASKRVGLGYRVNGGQMKEVH